MSSLLTNAPRFAIDTDFPLDKVVYTYSGSISLNPWTSWSGTVTQVTTTGLSYDVLPIMFYSTTPDFSICYQSESSPPDPNFRNIYLYNVNCSASGGKVTVNATSFADPAVTIYYRVFCFEPTNINLDTPATNVGVDNFMLNSDYNYTKLYLAGIASWTTTSYVSTPIVINHNLGYIPQVLCWTDDGTTKSPVDVSQIFPDSSVGGTTVDTINFSYFANGAPNGNLHYRIYLDA